MALTNLWKFNSWAITTDSVWGLTLTNNNSTPNAWWINWLWIEVNYVESLTNTYLSSTSQPISNWNSYTVWWWFAPIAQPSSSESVILMMEEVSIYACNFVLIYSDARIWWAVKWLTCVRSKNNVSWVNANYAITLDIWKYYHVLTTYDWSNFTLYVNWVKRATWAQSWIWSWWTLGMSIWNELNNWNPSYFSGRWRIDEVFVNNWILTDWQIKNIYSYWKGFI